MFDILITGAEVMDGTGVSPFHADIGINGETISEIGDLADASQSTGNRLQLMLAK